MPGKTNRCGKNKVPSHPNLLVWIRRQVVGTGGVPHKEKPAQWRAFHHDAFELAGLSQQHSIHPLHERCRIRQLCTGGDLGLLQQQVGQIGSLGCIRLRFHTL